MTARKPKTAPKDSSPKDPAARVPTAKDSGAGDPADRAEASGPAKAAPEPVKRWFLSDGTPYTGEDFQDAKGKPFGEMDVACAKCRGSGKRRFGRRRFGSCQECGGRKKVFEQVRIYSEAQIERKESTRQARRATITAQAAVKEAAAAARWQAWSDENAALVERAREADDPWMNDVLLRGEIYGSLTEGQVRAMREKIAELDAERRACLASRPVGSEKERLNLEVTCRRRGSFMGRGFGRRKGSREVFVTEMVDDAGNALIAITENFKLSAGDKASIRATVKEHDHERKPWPVTVLTRIEVLSLDPAPPPAEGDQPAREMWLDEDDTLPPLAPGEEPGACVDHGEGMNLPF